MIAFLKIKRLNKSPFSPSASLPFFQFVCKGLQLRVKEQRINCFSLVDWAGSITIIISYLNLPGGKGATGVEFFPALTASQMDTGE